MKSNSFDLAVTSILILNPCNAVKLLNSLFITTKHFQASDCNSTISKTESTPLKKRDQINLK